MIDLCRRLRAEIIVVVADWEEVVREASGQALPPAYRLMDTAEVVLGLVEATSREPVDLEFRRMTVTAAADHGDVLRSHGALEEIVFTEYDLLRRAIWFRLQWLEPDDARAADAIAAIDQAITIATIATLHGYHRREFEALGRWSEVIDGLTGGGGVARPSQPTNRS